MIAVARTRAELDRAVGSRDSAGTIGLVPTMGALHAGHCALIERAARDGGTAVVSIFVNPHQFEDAADFAAYPRSLDADLVLAEEAGASVVLVPEPSALFPPGEDPRGVDPGPLGDRLEGASRPGHFRGVATVVTRLFELVRPGRAYFGEKDFQQLVIVRDLAARHGGRVQVIACPTVREPDGLALSSRNARLTAAERAAAPVLYRALQNGAERIRAGARLPADVETAIAAAVGKEPLAQLDYATVVRAADCFPPPALEGELRLLVAARFGAIRLIDNLGAAA